MTLRVETLEPRRLLAGDCVFYGDLDPVPKTMVIQVLPHPDVNRDGVVNGLDISSVAARWGQDDGTDRMPIGGVHLSTIASHWLAEFDAGSLLSGELLDQIAADVTARAATVSPPSLPAREGGASGPGGGVEVHLPVIYPPGH